MIGLWIAVAVVQSAMAVMGWSGVVVAVAIRVMDPSYQAYFTVQHAIFMTILAVACWVLVITKVRRRDRES